MSKYQVAKNFSAVIDGKAYQGKAGQTIELSGIAEGRLVSQGVVRPATVTHTPQSNQTTK